MSFFPLFTFLPSLLLWCRRCKFISCDSMVKTCKLRSIPIWFDTIELPLSRRKWVIGSKYLIHRQIDCFQTINYWWYFAPPTYLKFFWQQCNSLAFSTFLSVDRSTGFIFVGWVGRRNKCQKYSEGKLARINFSRQRFCDLLHLCQQHAGVFILT